MASWILLSSVLLLTIHDISGCKRLLSPATRTLREAGVNDRLDCWLSDDPANQVDCHALGCLWDDKVGKGIPQCFFPRAGYGYKLASSSLNYAGGFDLDLERMPARSRFGSDAQKLKYQVRYYPDTDGNYNTVRFKLYDPSTPRYEVPVLKHLDHKGSPWTYQSQHNEFEVGYGDDEVYGFNFQVSRTDASRTTIFNSSIGGLTFSDQFLQLATYLPEGCSLYGIGENPHPNYLHDMNYKTWPVFSRDFSPTDGYQNLYGLHPFYMCVEADGRAHGLFLLNSNAMEFTTLPAPGVSIRTTGGILDFFIFVGDSPNQVTSLYHQLIGKTFMPPYWALGFQLCRWGYTGLSDIEAVVNRTRAAQLPYDVQYSDIDYMDQKKDFTWDHENFGGLDKFVNDTKADGLRWVFILDPAILAVDPSYEPYVEAKTEDLFIHWPKDIPAPRRSNPPKVDTTKDVIYGNVWPSGPVAFPDFFRNGTRDWWKRSIARLYADLKFDGLWIDMNEPSNFLTNEGLIEGDAWHLTCPTNKFDDPAYLPLAARTWGRGIRMSEKTLCMASVQGDDGQYRHYDVHSLYGWSETEPTMRAALDLTGERSMVFSRSTYPSSGQHGGHWLGDNISRWVDLHRSIIGILEFNLFGIPYIGADICGFNGEAEEEMCMRWMQLGAFYPLSRNHNVLGTKPQDPAYWGGRVLEASRRALNIRYRLLPYLYTLFHAAHTRGTKVIYGLMDWYPKDPIARTVDTQFMWGDGLLISPVLNQGQQNVSAYLPQDDWYDYHTSLKLPSVPEGRSITITNLTDTPLLVRGGTIFPAQDPAVNTKLSRKNAISLLVYPTSGNQANGELFWDDGVAIDSYETKNYIHMTFSLNGSVFVINPTNAESVFKDSILLRDVVIFNTTTKATTATVNSVTKVPISKDSKTQSITIATNITARKGMPKYEIKWM